MQLREFYWSVILSEDKLLLIQDKQSRMFQMIWSWSYSCNGRWQMEVLALEILN